MVPSEEIRGFWASSIGIPEDQVTEDSNFFALGGSSVQACNLIQLLRPKFPNLEISTIYEFPIFKEFAQAVDTGNFQPQVIDFEAEIQLDLKLDASQKSTKARSIQKSLLTGVTGYLGPALLIELLSSTNQKVACLIRAESTEEAQKKLSEAIERSKFKSTFDRFPKSRLEILAGDLSEPYFGLEEPIYVELSKSTDAIYHAAAEVDQMKTYEQLKGPAVAIIKNVIKFATDGKLKWLHHVSTVGVFDAIFSPPGYGPHFAPEDFLPEKVDPKRLYNGYAQSKWVAEQLVRKALLEGVPGAIYRPGKIGMHSKLQFANPIDTLGSFLQACRKLGSFPHVSCVVPYVHLDAAAKMIVDQSVAFLQVAAAQNKVFHVIEAEIFLREFLQRDESFKYESLDLVAWEEKFKAQFQWNCKTDIGALAYLNYLKSRNIHPDGLVKRNISFTYQNSKANMNVFRSKIVLNYITAVFKSAQEKTEN